MLSEKFLVVLFCNRLILFIEASVVIFLDTKFALFRAGRGSRRRPGWGQGRLHGFFVFPLVILRQFFRELAVIRS